MQAIAIGANCEAKARDIDNVIIDSFIFEAPFVSWQLIYQVFYGPAL